MPAALAVLLNHTSGPGQDDGIAAQIESRFRAAGTQVHVHVVEGGDNLVEAARNLLREKPQRLVAAGGDGTVSAVASVLAGSGVPLAVLPLGTLNHFARDLGIPDDLDAAVRVALGDKLREIDVGEVNGRIFVNNSSVGLYPAMVRRRERQRRLGRGKWHAMLWAGYNALRAHPFLDLLLEVRGAEHRRRTPFLFIGNNVYRMQGFDIGVRERLDAGVLSLYLAHRTGRLGLLRLALRALLGRLYDGDDFEAATTGHLRIDARHKRLLVSRDGEVEPMELPLDYRIRPHALRVVVP